MKSLTFIWSIMILLGSLYLFSNPLEEREISTRIVPPIAVNDTVTATETDTLIIDVQANDTEPEGELMLTNFIFQPPNGTISVPSGNEIVYVANPGYVGADSFQYFVCDPSFTCDAAWVFIDVIEVNDPPIAVDDGVSIIEDTDTTIAILINDSDEENDSLSIQIISNPADGTATITNDSVLYVPDPDFFGQDTFIYVICDPEPLCDTAMVTITVNPQNDPPLPTQDGYTVNEDTTNYQMSPLINDIEPDGDTLTIGIFTQPTSGGMVTISGDSILIYTPPVDFNGLDTVYYEACDQFTCVVDTIVIDVIPINDPPIAVDDHITTMEDVPVAFSVLDNDNDSDDTIFTVTVTITPTNGTHVLDDSIVTYTPDPDYNGLDSLQYVICDPEPQCDTAWVLIDVTPVNDPPVTMDDFITVPEDTTNVSILPLANDSDPDTDTLIIGMFTTPTSGGTVTLSGDSTLIYNPPPDFAGSDTIYYEACDPIICTTDTLIITVTPINDPPIAIDDPVTIMEDVSVDISVLDNDSDVDDDVLTVTITIPPINGMHSLVDSIITYTPDPEYSGLDSLQYVICDPEPLCDTAWVLIDVTPVNDPPVTMDDFITVPEDTTNVSILPLANDSDPDTDTLIIGMFTTPTSGGTVILSGDSTLIYNPPPDFAGSDTIYYEACDPIICTTDTLIITVTPINDPPIAVHDPVTTMEDVPVDISVLDNDSDVDDNVLTVTITIPPIKGMHTLVDSVITYTPDPEYSGPDSLQYVICDPEPLCDTAWVLIDITPVNDPPVTMDDFITVPEDTTNVSILPLANDSDADMDTLAIGMFTMPTSGGTIILSGDSILIYNPPPDFAGSDTIYYEACDPIICTTDTLIITVTPINDPPTAADDPVTTMEDIAVDISVLDNDSDVDDNVLTVTITIPPTNGSYALVDSVITYTPDPEYSGPDSLQYVICDPEPLCDTAWVLIDITPVNDPPVTMDDFITVPEDTTNVSILPLANDSDADMDTLAIGMFTMPTSGGTVILSGDSILIYNPPPDFAGSDTIYYEACDPIICTTDTLIITVTPINDPPTAADDPVTTMEDIAVDISVLDNDSDVDDNVLTVTITIPPTNGSYALVDSIITYTPDPEYNGLDSLQYVICDPEPLCDTAWVLIAVTPVNDPPVTMDDFITVPEDTTNVSILPLSNDSDLDGDTLSIGTFTQPMSGGTIVLVGDSTFIYSPPANFNGSDTVFFESCDQFICVIDTLVITVLSIPDFPIAVNDTISIFENDSTLVAILDNDSNTDGDALTVFVTTSAPNGFTDLVNDTIKYVPNIDYFGPDSIEYMICNTSLLCDTAQIIIDVIFVNDPPIAADDMVSLFDTSSVIMDVTFNDMEPNGDSLIIKIINGASLEGTATVTDSGTILYQPNDQFLLVDTLEYVVCDNRSPALTDTAIVVITMNCPAISHNLQVNPNICPNTPFTIFGADVYDLVSWEWSISGQPTVLSVDTALIGYTIATNTTFVLKSQRFGCLENLNTITVDPRENVARPDITDDVIECENTRATLSVENSIDSLSYDWYAISSGLLVHTGTTLTYDPLTASDTGRYYVIARDAHCQSINSDTGHFDFVTDFTPPLVNAGSDIITCADGVSLAATPVDSSATWSTNGLSFISDTYDPNSLVFGLESGENKFYWTKLNKVCLDNSIDSISIFYFPEPVVNRDSFMVDLNQTTQLNLTQNDELFGLDHTVALSNTHNEIMDNGGGLISVTTDGNSVSPMILEYEVCYQDCPDACNSSIVYIYFEQRSNCRIPTVMTPNGDGKNDTFLIPCISEYPDSRLVVFNRWGDEVFSSNNYDNLWDGTFRNEHLPVGTYFYILEVNDGFGTMEKGYIYLDR